MGIILVDLSADSSGIISTQWEENRKTMRVTERVSLVLSSKIDRSRNSSQGKLRLSTLRIFVLQNCTSIGIYMCTPFRR
jgi:hypothetical protein